MRFVSFAQDFTVAVCGCSAHGGVPCVAETAEAGDNGHKAALLVTLDDLVHVSLDGEFMAWNHVPAVVRVDDHIRAACVKLATTTGPETSSNLHPYRAINFKLKACAGLEAGKRFGGSLDGGDYSSMVEQFAGVCLRVWQAVKISAVDCKHVLLLVVEIGVNPWLLTRWNGQRVIHSMVSTVSQRAPISCPGGRGSSLSISARW
jgi:hypothetical protein